jgi:hypothetical protein
VEQAETVGTLELTTTVVRPTVAEAVKVALVALLSKEQVEQVETVQTEMETTVKQVDREEPVALQVQMVLTAQMATQEELT